MRAILTVACVVLVPALASAQLVEPVAVSWTLFVYPRGATQLVPISTTPIPGSAVTCNLDPTPATASTNNPTTIEWNDPALAGKVCRSDQATLLAALPLGLYDGTLSATDAEGVESSPSTRVPFSNLVPGPTNVRVRLE